VPIQFIHNSEAREYAMASELKRQKECLRLKNTKN
jgi:hypothetical protein